ncbi:hypothetical protein ASD04_07685 [Devosia sp. Root436]|jgi:hypothetical protein|uniref:hypothetical protein n=1 Tax=Devosia sp. Root436 TaxID=1736537 RepID=UPI0006FE33EE|nr:hypothetical protein [Devosia sp. Root436]KQX40489.1 hypothetical protein ASD04_07685 [Devosia sp. Root436]
MGRDAVLEGAQPLDIEQLQLLAQGRSATASPQQLARIEAKGWLETVGGIHLITLTGRTLLERRPFNLG